MNIIELYGIEPFSFLVKSYNEENEATLIIMNSGALFVEGKIGGIVKTPNKEYIVIEGHGETESKADLIGKILEHRTSINYLFDYNVTQGREI